MWYCLHTAAGLRCGLSPRVRALHTHCDAGRFSDIRADLTVILLLCSMCAFLHAGRRVLHVFAAYLEFRNDLPAQVDYAGHYVILPYRYSCIKPVRELDMLTFLY